MNEQTKYKVLIVDDSPFMRRLLTDILDNAPNLQVVGTAFNGEIALDKVKKLNPDVITLDIEMPVMNGIETLKALKKISTVPVVMFSSHTKMGAEITLNALELGAFDFAQKPDEQEGIKIEDVQEELIKKVITAAKSTKNHPIPKINIQKPVRVQTELKTNKMLVIGASTGGPGALKTVLSSLPANFPAKILVVQHMPAKFTEMFANRLNSICKIAVAEAKQGDIPEPGKALIAPGNFHMILNNDGKITLNQEPQVCGVRPAVDVTFKSASSYYGKNLICVILTGMGHDGSEGVKIAKERGAYCIAEHESSCVVYGMPKGIIEAGHADAVAPLQDIPEEIIKALSV